MAKSKALAQTQPRPRARRKPADTEHVTRLLVVGGVIAVVAIAAGIIGFGWYQTKIKPLGKTVLEVGEMHYSLGTLERRMELLRSEGSFYEGQNIFALPGDAMEALTVEAQLLQGAGELGVSITDEEFATEIKDRGGVSEDAEAEVYAAAFTQQVEESGLHEGEFRNMVEAELLQKKLADYFKFGVGPNEVQIKADYMIIEADEEAQEAVSRLRAGEDFATVAQDVGAGQATGTLDWTPRGGSAFLPDEVETYLFETAQPNQIDDPLEAGGAFYVLRLNEKDPNRPLDDTTRERAAQRELRKWIEELDIVTVERLSEEDETKALTDIL